MRFDVLKGLLASLTLVSLAACGGSEAAPAAAPSFPQVPAAEPLGPATPAGLPALPSPAQLPRSTSVIEEERWSRGRYYNSDLPFNLVNTELGTGWLRFSPGYDPATPGAASGLAYAGYVFYDYGGYGGAAEIHTHWDSVDRSLLWIGVANFQLNNWQWFSNPAGPTLSLPSLSPYIAPDGRIALVIVLLGNTPARLNSIVVGDAMMPLAALGSDASSNPQQRLAPLTVNFDTSLSAARGSDLELFEIDYDGDGSYDDTSLASAGSPAFSHTYTAPGNYPATLRVTDAASQSATESLNIHVINPANTGPSASFTPSSSNGTAPRLVSFDASASSDPDGSIIEYWWDFDNDGGFDYFSSTPLVNRNFSNFGTTTVRLRVVDNDLATHETTGTVSCTKGWRHTELTSVSYFNAPPSVVVQGSGAAARPCIAYTDSGSLRFMRGTDNTGLNWGTPLSVASPLPTHYVDSGCSMVIENMSQVPAIAYGQQTSAGDQQELRFIRATSSTGANWSAPVTVSSDAGCGLELALLQSGGRMIIMDSVGGGNYYSGQLLVRRSTDSVGSAWETVKTLMSFDTESTIWKPELLAIPGQNPLVAWAQVTDNIGTQYWCSHATSLDGANWVNPIAIPVEEPQTAGSQLSLALSGGKPVFASGRGHISKLWFNSAADAQGSSWPNQPGWLEDNGASSSPSIAVVGGFPAIAYVDSNHSEVRYIVAADAAGTGWNQPEIVSGQNIPGGYSAMAVLPGDVPLIVYENWTTRKLMAAVFF